MKESRRRREYDSLDVIVVEESDHINYLEFLDELEISRESKIKLTQALQEIFPEPTNFASIKLAFGKDLNRILRQVMKSIIPNSDGYELAELYALHINQSS